METLFFILLFLLVWMGTGHLMWLVVAACFRALSSPHCDVCNEVCPPGKTRCQACGQKSIANSQWDSAEPSRPDPLKDVTAATRLLQLAEYKKWITPEQGQELKSSIAAMKRRVLEEELLTQPVAAKTLIEHLDLGVSDNSEDSIPTTAPLVRAIERTESHPLEQVEAPEVFANSATSKVSLKQRLTKDMLQAFMQQANVKWIELISAALIVICSVGLVVSLWSTLSNTSRFFPAILFCLATVTVHAAGHYTLWKWKLRSTSRGVLHIALLLIPLAVLVGILLSRRADQTIEFDNGTIAIIVSGALVYSSLAWWTSRTLFGRRHWFVTAATVTACVSLLLSHVFRELGQASLLAMTTDFGPMMASSFAAAFYLTQSNARRWALGRPILSRSFAMVVQILFGVLTAGIFFLLRFGAAGLQSTTFFTAAGAIAFVWLVYSVASVVGFRNLELFSSEGLLGKHLVRAKQSELGGGTTSQLISICHWVFASTITPALLWFAWQTAETRPAIVGLLALMSIWLFSLSRFGGFPMPRTAIAISAAFAIAFSVEGVINRVYNLQLSDWLEWPKVAGMIVTAFLFGASSRIFPACWRKAYQTTAIVSSALATLAACAAAMLQLGGRREFAVWPELVLAWVGLAALALVIYWEWRAGRGESERLVSVHRLADIISILGVGFIGIAALHYVRLNTSFTLLGDAVKNYQLNAIALCMVACASSLSGWILALIGGRPGHRADEDTKSKISFLSGLSIRLSELLTIIGLIAALISSAIVFWPENRCQLELFFGWVIVFATFALSDVYRSVPIREVFRLLAGGWVAIVLYHHLNHSPLAASLNSFAIISLSLAVWTVVTTASKVVNRWSRLQWNADQFYWATGLAGGVSFGATLLMLIFPAASQLWQSLIEVQSPAIAERQLQLPDFLKQFSVVEVSAVAISFGAIVASIWMVSGRDRTQRYTRLVFSWLLAMTPFALALLVASAVPIPYTLVAVVWTLAFGLAGLIALQNFGLSPADQPLAVAQPDGSLLSAALDFGLVITVFLLTVLSGLAFNYACTHQLPSPLIQGNWFHSQMWMLPLTLVLSTGWVYSSLRRVPLTSCLVVAYALATWVACSGLLIDHRNQTGFIVKLILFAQLFIAASLILQWARVGLESSRVRLMVRSTASSRPYRYNIRMHQSCLTTSNLMLQSLLSLCALSALSLFRVLGRSELLAYLTSPLAILIVILMSATLFALPTLRSMQFLNRHRFAITAMQLISPIVVLAIARYGRLIGSPLPSYHEVLRTSFAMSIVIIALMIVDSIRQIFSRCRSSFSNVAELRTIKQLLPLKRISRIDARATLILRGLCTTVQFVAIAVIIGLAVTESDRILSTVVLASLSLMFLLWSFNTSSLWGYASAVLACLAIIESDWFHAQPTALTCLLTVLYGPLAVALSSVGLRTLITKFTNATLRENSDTTASEVLNPALGLRQITMKQLEHRVLQIEAAVAFALPTLMLLLSLFVVLDNDVPRLGLAAALSITLVVAALVLSGLNFFTRVTRSQVTLYVALFAVMLLSMAWLSCGAGLSKQYGWMLYLVSFTATPALAAAWIRTLSRSSWIANGTSPISQRLREINVDASCQQLFLFHLVVAIVGLVPTVVLSLICSDANLRSIASAIPFLSALSLLWLPRDAVAYRCSSIALLSLSVLLMSIRDLPSLIDGTPQIFYLHAVHLFGGCIAYAAALIAVARLEMVDKSWNSILYRSSWLTCSLAFVCGAIGLAIPTLSGQGSLPSAQSFLLKLAVLGGWILLAGRALQFSVKPVFNEPDRSMRQRKFAVYVVEAIVVAFGLQIYVFFPELFGGWVREWWPVVVMFIVMTSIAIGQLLKLDRSEVFGNPLRQTNLLLPLLPLSSVWILQQQGDWTQWSNYGSLLIGATILYSVQSWIYRSMPLQIVATVTGVLSLWSFLLNQETTRFLMHPQFWLVPPAISALYFVERNRNQFSRSVLVAARYFAVLTAYLSSTADMLLLSFGGSIWMPIVLLALSMLGVAIGMVKRITPLLYCGVTFILVSLVGMVWHAQRAIGEVWPWWAFGIACGVGLIVLLGYIEKNRDRVATYLRTLNAWD